MKNGVKNVLDIHILWVTPIFRVGGFSFFVFLNSWASIVMFLIVFYLGKNFLFKSILAGCDRLYKSFTKQEN